MRRERVAALAVAVLLTGCGIGSSEVVDGGPAPTGVAPGTTLYFLDERGGLRPETRDTGRLLSISEAMSLLLTGPGGSDLDTAIEPTTSVRVVVSVEPDLIDLRTPLALEEVGPEGIDQIVCTALATHVQSGGSVDTEVRVGFTLDTPESDKVRSCPLIGS